MKRVHFLLVVLATLLGASQAYAQDDWRTVQGPEGVFSVEMPGEVTDQTKPIGPPGAPVYLLHSYVAIRDAERFAAQTFQLPAPGDISQPRVALQALVDKVGAVLAGEKWQKITWLDMPMTTAVAATGIGTDDQVLRAFLAVKGARFFILLFGGPPGSEVGPNAERFFNSFNIR